VVRSRVASGRASPLILTVAAGVLGFVTQGPPRVLFFALATIALVVPLARGLPQGDFEGPWANRLFPFLVVAVALAAGVPSLSTDFLGDDFGWVFLFHDRPLSEIFDLKDISHGVWGGLPLDELRPLFTLSFRLNAALSGANPVGYHVVNVFLHALNCLLVYSLGRLVFGRPLPSFVGALFFALSPGHAEAIAWVSGRVDLLPTAFYLGSLVAFIGYRSGGKRSSYLLSLGLFAVGLFSKEILITLPVLLVAADVFSARELGWKRSLAYVPFGFCACAYLLLRQIAFGNFARERRFIGVSSFLAGQAHDLRPFLPPFDLMRHGTLSIGNALLGGALLGLLLVGLIAFRGSLRSLAFLGPVFYAVTALPLLVTYSSARHLYLPSAGPLLALAFLAMPHKVSVPRILGVVLFLLASSSGLLRHEGPWQRAGAFSRTAREEIARVAPQIPKGSLVVLTGIPNEIGETMVWDFALPFALQRPFLGGDLYDRFRVLESPGIYCCPVGEWFRARKALLGVLLAGSTDEPLEVYSLHWNPRRGAIVAMRGVFTRGELVSRASALYGRSVLPPETAAEAQAGVGAVLEAARTLCTEPLGPPS
jgi:hypothetical protein